MTTNTKELLTLAARAAGKLYDPTRRIKKEGMWVVREGARHQDDMVLWNPATNSGDSWDLQVKLRISLTYNADGTWTAYALADDGFVGINADDTDPNMAVLLVAAELGKAMEGV